MIKKVFFLVIILFNSTIGFSQENSGLVKYKVVNIKKKETTNKSLNFNRLDSEFEKIAVKLKFELLFANNASSFKIEDNLNIDGDDLYIRMAKTILGANSIYYADIEDNKLVEEKSFLGESFFIESSLDEYNWNVTREKRNIKGYECIKAIGTRVGKDRNFKPTSVPIIAWFTPSINLPFGPFESIGLPGLVLDFSIKDFSIIVDKIEFGKISKIKMPDPDKLITTKTFDEKIESFSKGS